MITIDWLTSVISVPQSYLTFVSGTLYDLDTDQFRLDLLTLLASQEGMPFVDTHVHNTQVTIAGVTYARLIEIINGYTVTFEDGQYAVRLSGSNNNIFDEGIINRNQVSIIPTNSAGLQIVTTGGGGGPTLEEIVDGVWDELLTGGTHNINKSAGKILRGLGNLVVVTDTAQGSGTGPNQIELHAGASAVDGAYDPALIAIVDGTGAGQSRNILEYDGPSRTATVDRDWKVLPDNTSEFVIYGDAGREHVNEGLAQAGTANTITLNALASSTDGTYVHQTVSIRSGTGQDQIGIVIAYNGTSKVATVWGPAANGDWAVIPDTTSAYVMLPHHNNISTEQFSAYAAHIVIDVANGEAGTTYPTGTRASPVNNLADAKTLGLNLGINTFEVNGLLPIGASDVIDDLVFEGQNELTDLIILTAGCSTVSTVFRSLSFTGVVGGDIFAVRCALQNVTEVGSDAGPSLFDQCALLDGTIGLRSGLTTPGNVQFTDCFAGLTGGGSVTFDMNGTTAEVGLRSFRGELSVRNYTGVQPSVLGFAQGSLDVDGTCTAGSIEASGTVKLTGTSGGTTVTYLDASGDFLTADRATLTLVLDLLEADETFTQTAAVKFRRGTAVELLRKVVTGGNIRPVTVLDP